MRHVTSMLIFVPRSRGNNEDNKQQTYVNTSTASFPPTRQMAEYDRSGTCRSASWRTTATRLLRNSTRSQSATPTEIELTGLCITFQQCQSDQLLGLHNIGVIRDFFFGPQASNSKATNADECCLFMFWTLFFCRAPLAIFLISVSRLHLRFERACYEIYP